MIVTFYSFKGGVGRSMALVNVAEILADRGYRVIACDWDLEAPGLERYFTSREVDGVPWESVLEQLIKAPGLIDLLTEYRDSLSSSIPRPASEENYARLGDVLVRRPSTVALPVSAETGSSPNPKVRTGSLRLISAGRRDGAFQQTYAEVVRSFDWEEFYNRWAGGSYVEFMRRDLVGTSETTAAADILLIDSRTGVTEQGGICTHHLADLVVLMSAANDANLAGIEWMAEGLSDERLAVLRGDRPLQVLPVAARIEQGAQKEELVDFRRRFTEKFRRYVARASGVSVAPEEFGLYTEIPYMAFYSFTERVVAREPEERREQNLYMKYQRLADAIEANGVSRKLLAERGPRVVRPRAGNRINILKRRQLVYLSIADRDSPLALTIRAGLSGAGHDVITRADARPDAWRRSSRFVVLSEGTESPAQMAEIAEMRRQAALRPEVRIMTLLAGNQPRRTEPALSPFMVPRGIGEEDRDYFEALAEEIASSDVRPSQEVRIDPPGARAMMEEDAAVFFGRDTELMLAARWPEARRWLDITGDSGMGKTSFVQAGLIPMIRRGEIRAIAEDAPITVVRIESELPEVNSSGVVILEDCQRLATIDAERLRNWWRQLALTPSSRDYCLVTVGRTGNPLSTLRDAGPQPVSITLSGLRLNAALQALACPAILTGVKWESGLPRRIVCDLANAGGSGPSDEVTNPTVDPSLLALVIAELVDGKTSQITHEKYDQSGWIGDRLAGMASRALQAIEEPGRTLARALLARLVSPEGEPRVLAAEEALEILGSDQLLEQMSGRRLVRIGTHVELRHPMLARWWPSLRQWAAIEGERIAPAEALKNAMALWEATGHAVAALPQGRALEFIDSVAQQNSEARAFVKGAKRTQKIRSLVHFLLAIIFFAIGFLVPIWIARHNRAVTAEGKADRLATLSLAAADPTQALVLAIAAGEAAETPRSRDALVKAVPRSRLRAVLKHDGKVITAALSPDSKTILSVTSEGTIVKWDASSGASLSARKVPGPVTAADISRDLLSVAVLDPKGFLLWLYLDPARTRYAFASENVLSFAISPSGSELAVGSKRASYILRKPGDHVIPLEADGSLFNVSFTHDGETVVANSDKQTLNIWTRLHDPVLKPVLDAEKTNRSGSWSLFAINAAGNRILTSGAGGASMWIIDATRNPALSRAQWSLFGQGFCYVGDDSFGNNDQNVALRTVFWIHVWRADVPSGGIMIKPPLGNLSSVAFDPHRPQLVAADVGGRIAICRLNAKGNVVIDTTLLIGHTDSVNRAFFSPDGSTVISASNDNTVRLWWINDIVIPKEFDKLLDVARKRLPVTMSNAERAAILAQAGETP